MDFRSLAQMLGYLNPAQSDYAKNTTVVPKNEVDRAAIVHQIMQGMARPKRPEGDLPQGQPVQVAGDVPVKPMLPPTFTPRQLAAPKNQGIKAFHDGKGPEANPYTPGAKSWDWWMQGYESQK